MSYHKPSMMNKESFLLQHDSCILERPHTLENCIKKKGLIKKILAHHPNLNLHTGHWNRATAKTCVQQFTLHKQPSPIHYVIANLHQWNMCNSRLQCNIYSPQYQLQDLVLKCETELLFNLQYYNIWMRTVHPLYLQQDYVFFYPLCNTPADYYKKKGKVFPLQAQCGPEGG